MEGKLSNVDANLYGMGVCFCSWWFWRHFSHCTAHEVNLIVRAERPRVNATPKCPHLWSASLTDQIFGRSNIRPAPCKRCLNLHDSCANIDEDPFDHTMYLLAWGGDCKRVLTNSGKWSCKESQYPIIKNFYC